MPNHIGTRQRQKITRTVQYKKTSQIPPNHQLDIPSPKRVMHHLHHLLSIPALIALPQVLLQLTSNMNVSTSSRTSSSLSWLLFSLPCSSRSRKASRFFTPKPVSSGFAGMPSPFDSRCRRSSSFRSRMTWNEDEANLSVEVWCESLKDKVQTDSGEKDGGRNQS